MQIRSIDELNTLSKPPKEYFGEMDLTKAQVEERVRFTEKANEEFLLAMELMATMSDYGSIDYDRAKTQLEDNLALLIDTFIVLDEYLRQYASDSAQNFVDATRRNADKEWYFSEDRALYNAENSANDTLNYKDYVKAIEDGYTHKKWLTERDPKVRPTHRELEGQTIGIMEYFVVGNALMRFPKDYELAYDAPEETVNCRCSIKYLNREKAQNDAVAKTSIYDKIKSRTTDFINDNTGGIVLSDNEPPYRNDKAVIPKKKVTQYLLDPEKDHYNEFVEAGYSRDNPDALANDILMQFDLSKRIDEITKGSALEFVQMMTLGVGKERTFRTVWRIDDEFDGLPRFISAYRNRIK